MGVWAGCGCGAVDDVDGVLVWPTTGSLSSGLLFCRQRPCSPSLPSHPVVSLEASKGFKMKQIAFMGLMAAALAVGIYGCSSGADVAGDGGIQDNGTTSGSDASDGGNVGQDAATGGDEYKPDGGVVDVGLPDGGNVEDSGSGDSGDDGGSGSKGACHALLNILCDCKGDQKEKDACHSDADKTTFSDDQDTKCSKYLDTCDCEAYLDPVKAKTACPS